jgi:hypothetical protein
MAAGMALVLALPGRHVQRDRGAGFGDSTLPDAAESGHDDTITD